eukprot:scaffold1862_cov268-Chaetoceros_neogracile.AAC.6
MIVSTLLQRSSTLYPHSPFIAIGQKILTYKDSNEISKAYKVWIQNNLYQQLQQFPGGKEVEVVIAFLSHNSPDLIIAMIASMENPVIVRSDRIADNRGTHTIMTAMLNVRWSPHEVTKALAVRQEKGQENSGLADSSESIVRHLTIILYGDGMGDQAREACRINNMDELQSTLNHKCCSFALPKFDSQHLRLESDGELALDYKQIVSADRGEINDDALLLFTSGTTSGPKGVRLSNLSLITQAMAKIAAPCSYNCSTRMLATTVPFFHVGGISSALAVIMAGGLLVFPSTDSIQGFDPHLVLNSMSESTQIRNILPLDLNTLVIVPTMLYAILQEIESKKIVSYDKVQLILVGGQSITSIQLQKSKLYFPNAKIVQTFACTEAGSSITFATLFDRKSRTALSDSSKVREMRGSLVGVPPHHIGLQIFELNEDNEATNQIAKPFTIGAIGTKGSHVMNGYWRRGLSSKNQLSKDWLKLNDLGYMDSKGQLFFCGRSNDVIRTGGETVFAPEVEQILIQHPDIDQCAVFALPDERFGERVCAAVVYKMNQNHSTSISSGIRNVDRSIVREIRSFCETQKLSGFKRPRAVFQCRDLPRNSSGKVLKHQLAAKCKASAASIVSKL